MIILIHIHTDILKQENKPSYNNQPDQTRPRPDQDQDQDQLINFIHGCDE